MKSSSIMQTYNIFLMLIIIGFVMAEDILKKKGHIRCSDDHRCRCIVRSDGSIKADCSKSKIKNIPKFFGNVTVIDLSKNELAMLPGNLVFPPSVLHLDLSVNNISRMDENAFKKLPNLQILNLACNMLQYDIEIFKSGLFLPLLHLKTLLLHHNIADDMNFELYPTAISELKSLTTLTLDGKNGARFDSSFRQLKKLQRVTISGIKGKCDITWLPKHFFLNTPFIKHLDLTGCNLLQMDKGLLQPLRHLNFLNISFNILLTFDVLSNVSFDLQWTNIKVFDFSNIHCTFGPGTVVFRNDTVFLKNTSLETIIFDNNRLATVDPRVLQTLPDTVHTMSCKGNRLSMGLYVLFLSLMRHLRVIHIDHQYTSYIITEYTNRLALCNDWRAPTYPKLTSGNFLPPSQCNTDDFNDTYSFFSKFNSYIMGKEYISLRGIPFEVPLPKRLSEVYFPNSGLDYVIPEMKLRNPNSVRKLIFHNNILRSWIGPVRNLHKLTHLDLSNCVCSNVTSYFFSDVPSLRFLNISNNFLGFVLSAILPFQSLQKLETLDVSFNNIQNLSQNIFANLSSLTHLHLQSNLMRDWQFDIGYMNQLRFLDISNNQLTSIPATIRNHLKRLASQRRLRFKLQGNRFRCDCHNIDFIKWMIDMQRDHRVFLDYNTYSCSTPNDTIINFSELSNFLLELNALCANYSFLILGVIVAIFLSVTLLVCGIVYRYRWRLRFLYYMTKSRFFGRIVVRQPETRQNYQYDAFISYADEDGAFVRENLLNELGVNLGLKLCLHQLDFIAGLPIAENITIAINNSRKTVIIFSENYLKSEWCMYEFNMARVASMYSDVEESKIFLVMYKHVPTKKIPLQILELCKRDSYIEYPNDPEEADIVFYNNFAKAIRV